MRARGREALASIVRLRELSSGWRSHWPALEMLAVRLRGHA